MLQIAYKLTMEGKPQIEGVLQMTNLAKGQMEAENGVCVKRGVYLFVCVCVGLHCI